MVADNTRLKDQFDALQQMIAIAKWFIGAAASEQSKPEGGNRKVIAEHLESASRVLKEILPYQHSRLATVTLKPVNLDLSRLTDRDLKQVETAYAILDKAAVDPDDGTVH